MLTFDLNTISNPDWHAKSKLILSHLSAPQLIQWMRDKVQILGAYSNNLPIYSPSLSSKLEEVIFAHLLTVLYHMSRCRHSVH